MRRVGAFAVLVFAGLVVAGIVFLPRGERVRLVPQKGSGRGVRSHWESELARGAMARPDIRFSGLSTQEFKKRLAEAAERYDFDVEEVEFLRPKQLAPLVVARSAEPYALAKEIPKVTSSLDPKAPTGDDLAGWAWEGFYFEVRDHANKPAFVVLNYWRLGGGGQWAAEESLYPFPHSQFASR